MNLWNLSIYLSICLSVYMHDLWNIYGYQLSAFPTRRVRLGSHKRTNQNGRSVRLFRNLLVGTKQAQAAGYRVWG